MASPVINIRDTGRNSSRTGDVRALADNVVTSWTSTTTGTIAVTAAANTGPAKQPRPTSSTPAFLLFFNNIAIFLKFLICL